MPGKEIIQITRIYAPESVLESPRDVLEIPHPSGASSLSSLGLLSPLIRADLSRWESTRSTSWFNLRVDVGIERIRHPSELSMVSN